MFAVLNFFDFHLWGLDFITYLQPLRSRACFQCYEKGFSVPVDYNTALGYYFQVIYVSITIIIINNNNNNNNNKTNNNNNTPKIPLPNFRSLSYSSLILFLFYFYFFSGIVKEILKR